MVRSSLPLSSPLMTTDLPIFTMSFSMQFLVVSCRGIGTPTIVGAVDEVDACGPPGRTASSRFHISSSGCPLQGALSVRTRPTLRRESGVAGQYMGAREVCLVLL